MLENLNPQMGAALATAGVLMAASFGSHAASMTFRNVG